MLVPLPALILARVWPLCFLSPGKYRGRNSDCPDLRAYQEWGAPSFGRGLVAAYDVFTSTSIWVGIFNKSAPDASLHRHQRDKPLCKGGVWRPPFCSFSRTHLPFAIQNSLSQLTVGRQVTINLPWGENFLCDFSWGSEAQTGRNKVKSEIGCGSLEGVGSRLTRPLLEWHVPS